MADHLGHQPDAEQGLLARARGHLVDLTPLRVSRDFRLLFLGKSVSDFGDEIVASVVPFQVYEITRLDARGRAARSRASSCPSSCSRSSEARSPTRSSAGGS